MKKLVKAIGLCVILCILLTALIGCKADDPTPKVFNTENLNITLNTNFRAQAASGYTMSFVDLKNTIVIFTLQEKFSLVDGFENWSLEKYISAIKNNAPTSEVSEIAVEDGITYFDYEFTNTTLNLTYYYYTTAFKDETCFWLVQFSCLAKDREDMRPVFLEYAKSITFEN